MLNAEEAKKRLEAIKSKTFVSERIARLNEVPDPIREDVRTLFRLEPAPTTASRIEQWQRERQGAGRQATAYYAIPAEEREDAIRRVYPEIAPYILRALNDAGRLPYTFGFGRKPFRSPSQPKLLDRSRIQFLTSLIGGLSEYPADIEWIAAWAPHAWPYNDAFVSRLLAAAIDEGGPKGDAVFGILLASGRGEHEIGQMGTHVIRSLLIAARPAGWEFVEKLLIAAQREEGLRQSILEAVDECHPEAFTRFLRLVLEHDLVRFSATVRAVDVWFGFQWDAMSAGKARQIIEQTLQFLQDPAQGDSAIAAASLLPAAPENRTNAKKLIEPDERIEPAYVALWAKAFTDVRRLGKPARTLLNAPNSEVRFIATHLLCQLQLVGPVSTDIASMMDDADERVAARALMHFSHNGHYRPGTANQTGHPPDLFERIEKLLNRAPAKTVQLAPVVWPWMRLSWGKQYAGVALVFALATRPPTRLLPYIDDFDPRIRYWVVQKLGSSQTWDDATRDTLFRMVGDASPLVRAEALKHLKKCAIAGNEAIGLERYLTRKTSDLRRAVLILLLSQSDEGVLASADRLLDVRTELPRLAGLELLRELAAAGRSADAARQRASRYRAGRPDISADEKVQLDALISPIERPLTLDDCLGLIDPADRTPPLKPARRTVQYISPAALELLKGLDELVHQNRERPFTPRNYHDEAKEDVLLGNARWEFPRVNSQKPAAEQLERLPYKDIWLEWFDRRPASMRDADGFELLRANWKNEQQGLHFFLPVERPRWIMEMTSLFFGDGLELRYPSVTLPILHWLTAVYPPKHPAGFLLDGLENGLAIIPPGQMTVTEKPAFGTASDVVWREGPSPVMGWTRFAERLSDEWSPDEKSRLYRLLRWIDEPGVPIGRHRASLPTLLVALSAGGASEADVYDHFLGPRPAHHYASTFRELGETCSLAQPDRKDRNLIVEKIAHRCRDRVLEVELERGETPTIVSAAALALKHSGGLDVLARFLRVAEKNTFARGRFHRSESKAATFSHVIRATYPRELDTPAAFATAMKDANIGETRLLELAVYAPQWADHVGHVFGWAELAEAVWWIHAHTRDHGWSIDATLRERWKAQVARLTPLAAEDLLDGAVDVTWFRRTYETLGKKRWAAVHDVAKFAASGGGHKRAQLFADAMLGLATSKELTERITGKRNQDSVRALGLLPLPAGDKGRAQILARYKTLQEFVRTSRQFGSQRQASEKRAAAIGMENLARTAGYADPIRLQWAMEAEACADLAAGPVSVTAGDFVVRLAVDAQGMPDLSCLKKGKSLAAIPASLKKAHPEVSELAERKTELKRSSSRMRGSLEQAMVRGDTFSAAELRVLMTNPLIAPMLARLIFIGQGVVGYPVDGGQGLIDCDGKIEPLKKEESLRLAHPSDLLATQRWEHWQHDCFRRERVQPFKQVFRELYVLTPTESAARDGSRRYAGHQVQPKQALALLGTRGWVTSPEEGVFRAFHEAGWTAFLTFGQPFFTPADIEGLTLEGVRFLKKGKRRDWSPLSEVPSRLFSEVMRDLDLVVSVAHRGEVDPEASASTLQVRSALLGETVSLLGLKNVRIQENHALIKGDLAEYTVHLGSAVTHRQPGGALFIVAVHSQHRGRLFLPFADDDPKTAEVLSKVLLLARDREIKDPNLLAQIRALSP